ISNFNEKGVILGLTAVARVIVSGKTYRERLKNQTVIQPGSYKSVSIIKTIYANGSLLPAFLI
ncbi:uncharacterized protein K441DRAFT_573043, partial [Cenococcum geophilum 1.58]|uniref:uncharacterized protein n=1 Tax=Cenococcum geophilum 1.58 TaxID=794803 RepID=UPI00358EE84E